MRVSSNRVFASGISTNGILSPEINSEVAAMQGKATQVQEEPGAHTCASNSTEVDDSGTVKDLKSRCGKRAARVQLLAAVSTRKVAE